MALKIYQVKLKSGSEAIKVKATNADNAINKAKQKIISFRNTNRFAFDAKIIRIYKIQKHGFGKYRIIKNEEVIFDNLSLNAAKIKLKKLNEDYMSTH